MIVFCFSRIDGTIGSPSSNRDASLPSRNQSNNIANRIRTNRATSQLHSGQMTVLGYLNVVNERLTNLERQIASISLVLERIDDRLQPSTQSL